MTDAALSPPRLAVLPALSMRFVMPLCWAALMIGIAARLCAGITAPLWFDETFSAAIATQASIAALVRWMLTELSGPTYYSLLFAWERVAGDSNVALRLPSLICSIATPLLILWRGHPDRQVRMVWMALAALSIVGFDTATQARPYALLVLLATAQAIAFLRLVEQPGRARALAWTGVSALAVLTHYHAAIISGLQGVAFLLLCRERAVRCWPAAAPLVPMALWMAYHIPFILSFTTKDTVWYGTLGIDALWMVPSLLTGLAWPGALLLIAMSASFAHDAIAAQRGRACWPYRPGETALVASGVVAMILVVGTGFVLPSFTSRYLLPYLPAILAGVALWIRRLGRHGPIVAAPLLCLMTGAATAQLATVVTQPDEDFRYAFNFEQPSQWIAEAGVDHVVMLWDSPTAALDDPDGHIASVGSYFLRRAGHEATFDVPKWPRHGDPNAILLARAGERPHTAILWAYDASIAGTRGRVHPWAIPTLDRRWQCRDFGRTPITVLACVRR